MRGCLQATASRMITETVQSAETPAYTKEGRREGSASRGIHTARSDNAQTPSVGVGHSLSVQFRGDVPIRHEICTPPILGRSYPTRSLGNVLCVFPSQIPADREAADLQAIFEQEVVNLECIRLGAYMAYESGEKNRDDSRFYARYLRRNLRGDIRVEFA